MSNQKWYLEAKQDGKHLLCSECGEPVSKGDEKRFKRENNLCYICYNQNMRLRENNYGIGKFYHAIESGGY